MLQVAIVYSTVYIVFANLFIDIILCKSKCNKFQIVTEKREYLRQQDKVTAGCKKCEV